MLLDRHAPPKKSDGSAAVFVELGKQVASGALSGSAAVAIGAAAGLPPEQIAGLQQLGYRYGQATGHASVTKTLPANNPLMMQTQLAGGNDDP